MKKKKKKKNNKKTHIKSETESNQMKTNATAKGNILKQHVRIDGTHENRMDGWMNE